MKPTTPETGRLLFMRRSLGAGVITLIVTGLTIGLVSWDFKQSPGRYKQSANDTVPKTKSIEKEKKIRDLDEALDELNNAEMKIDMEKIQKEIDQAMKNVDMEKIKREVDIAVKEIDLDKIKKEVEASLSKVDMDQVKKEIEKAMSDVDYDKVKNEMAQALKEVDAAKIIQEVDASLARVDWEKIKTEMDEVKKIDMSKMETEMKKVNEEIEKMRPELKKEIEKAKVDVEKAKVELKEYKAFVDGLENDGLINKKEDYSIIHKDGELTVNGKNVSAEIYSKYRSFLEKHKKFRIKKEKDDFNIDLDD